VSSVRSKQNEKASAAISRWFAERGGWLDEVKQLLAAGIAPDAKIFDFIGYREMLGVLRGKLSMEQARATIQQATRNYAKRQLTWFRREPDVHWIEAFGAEPQTLEAASNLLRDNLGS